jgi:hypothetical protein
MMTDPSAPTVTEPTGTRPADERAGTAGLDGTEERAVAGAEPARPHRRFPATAGELIGARPLRRTTDAHGLTLVRAADVVPLVAGGAGSLG